MPPRREDTPFEHSLSGRIARASNTTIEFKEEFLKKAGCRDDKGCFTFKTLGIALLAHTLAQGVAHTNDWFITPEGPSFEEALSTEDMSISGAHNDLLGYLYAEQNNVNTYLLTMEDGRYALYTFPSDESAARYTMVNDYESAAHAIETHILPHLSIGRQYTAQNATGYDHIEYCDYISDAAVFDGATIRQVHCGFYPDETQEVATNRLQQRETLWQTALQEMSEDNYGFTAEQAASLPRANTNDDSVFEANSKEGLRYGGFAMAGWFALAGLGAAGSMARRRRDEHYQKNDRFRPH